MVICTSSEPLGNQDLHGLFISHDYRVDFNPHDRRQEVIFGRALDFNSPHPSSPMERDLSFVFLKNWQDFYGPTTSCHSQRLALKLLDISLHSILSIP